MPGLERIRLDADTASRPGALREALERFAAARSVALIGTQMVAKGHHFPGVEVAAVVDADAGLAFPDFRSEERTFQLVTQLAGRSGRDAPGRVIVQTFQPDATPFAFAVRHDVAGFLAQELARREELALPALFTSCCTRRLRDLTPATSLRALGELRARWRRPSVRLLGPAPLLRLRGRHRAQLLAKTDVAARLREPRRGRARARRAGDAPRRSDAPSSTSIRSRSSGPGPNGHVHFGQLCAASRRRYTRRDVRRTERRCA